MPTTPPQGAESDGVRPPCRTAAVTRVPSANSGHCTAILGTVRTLWEPATPCADVPSTALAAMLPTPCTSSTAEPSASIGVTLGRGTDLDQSKTPRQQDPRCTAKLSMEDGTFHSNHHDAHRSRQDAGAIPARLKSFPGRLPCPVLYSPVLHSVHSIATVHCTPPIRGEDDDF